MVNQNQDEWILAVGLEYVSHFPHGKLWLCIEAWIETIISCFPYIPYSLYSTCNSHNLVTILKILTGATWCQCASEATLPHTNWSGTRKNHLLGKKLGQNVRMGKYWKKNCGFGQQASYPKCHSVTWLYSSNPIPRNYVYGLPHRTVWSYLIIFFYSLFFIQRFD